MASKSKFFSKFLSFLLVLIIIGGVGFLGYNLMANKNMSMNMTSQSGESNSTQDKTSSDQDQMNMSSDSSSQDKMNMSGSDANEKSIPQYATNQVNTLLQDKEELGKNVTILKDTLELMTLDPYGADAKSQSQDSTQSTTGQANNNESDTNASVTNTQENAMQNMGTTYDPNKMQQLHNGLYKISVGMQLLNQLKDNVELQMEEASINYENTSQYYQNQYYMTVQNKNKLLEALTYVNEASTLLNINPYVSKDGAVYDKERMAQIHQSVYKFAEAVGGLNKLNDDFTKQTVSLGNLSQNSQNSQNSMNMPQMNQSSNSILGNINIATVANILLITFIVIFIVSIIGYIGRLLKPKEAK